MDRWLKDPCFHKDSCLGRRLLSDQALGVCKPAHDPTAAWPWPFSPEWPSGRERYKCSWGPGEEEAVPPCRWCGGGVFPLLSAEVFQGCLLRGRERVVLGHSSELLNQLCLNVRSKGGMCVGTGNGFRPLNEGAIVGIFSE